MMTPIRVVNRTRGTVLGDQIVLADTVLSRLRGFLFRGEPVTGEGILLSPCQAVHMFGMRFPLDVILIDESGTVVATHPDLRPWRWTPVERHALHALELPAGTILKSGTRTGDALSWSTTDAEPAMEPDVEPDAGDEDAVPESPERPARQRKPA